MKTTHFFCSDDQSQSLADFATRFFGLIGEPYTCRESSNYVGGEYFVGTSKGIKATVALCDEEGFDDRPYWVCFESGGDDNLPEQTEIIVAEQLLPAGIRVARIENFGRHEMRRIDY
jgi:hypothetical protein